MPGTEIETIRIYVLVFLAPVMLSRSLPPAEILQMMRANRAVLCTVSRFLNAP